MALLRWILGRLLRLPAKQPGKLLIDKGLSVPMRDGVSLLADYYHLAGDEPGPVVIMRSPYGREALFGLMAALLAERGLPVLLQSVRGTAGSGGELNPMHQERDDGADTLAWLHAQPWCSGQVFAFGASYLGNAGWAMASGRPDLLSGLVLQVTLSNFKDEILGGGGFTQAGTLGWTQIEMAMTEPGAKMERPKAGSLDDAHGHLPLGSMDKIAFGRPAPWWQQWLEHAEPSDPWWAAMNYSDAIGQLQAPVALVAGWQDVFLPYQIRDFQAAQAAGKRAWLTIGPWAHFTPGGMIEGLRQAAGLFGNCRRGAEPFAGRAPVRAYLQVAKQWLELPSWPPPGVQTNTLYLHADGRLSETPPASDEGARGYTYDPADPTPALHGPMVMGSSKKPVMTALEQRADVLSYSAEAVSDDLDLLGAVSVQLAVHSDRADTDFFVCLCDVDRRGVAVHICDGYRRLRPGQPPANSAGVRLVTIDCWPTAYRLRRGHRLRLLVASGAHPRYARNLGTGAPLAEAVEMVTAQQQVLHQPELPCYVQISVR
ncbi:CocE/NonD family hydrolase [Halioxenophilus sp. WMMB6]|uniref:CocE/NonD family hydrolase n=1 Tax=Halioxenophilus sp. WMMB6 TaxID=3073815 RepID=UPI00295E8DB2|nr:CocE/NonD family hydrolase [Halioxenophilus sp. WMMB6]